MLAKEPHYFPDLTRWLNFLESAHPVGIDMGLGRVLQAKEALQLSLDCLVISVGGTNGKGSTCAFLEAILLSAGYRVACHTSPHLIRFNERARINGQEVTDDDLLEHFRIVEKARSSMPCPVSLTYFEFTTLAILSLFSKSEVDVMILEVGLGGRLDAINMIDADCAIITSIDLDHQAYLGDTREKIAYEKAGIYRSGKIAICSDPQPPDSLVDYAHQIGADLWLQGKDFNFQGDTLQWAWSGRGRRIGGLAYPALRGANQLLNASGVLAALTSLREILPVGVQDIRNGFSSVDLPGRFQVLPGQPNIVLDVAHNPHASATLSQSLAKMGYFPYTHAVVGMMADKDMLGVLKPMLGQVDYWYCVDLPTPRAARANQIVQALQDLGVKKTADSGFETFSNVAQAYQKTLERAGQNDRIVVFGSFYTVSGVLLYLQTQKH